MRMADPNRGGVCLGDATGRRSERGDPEEGKGGGPTNADCVSIVGVGIVEEAKKRATDSRMVRDKRRNETLGRRWGAGVTRWAQRCCCCSCSNKKRADGLGCEKSDASRKEYDTCNEDVSFLPRDSENNAGWFLGGGLGFSFLGRGREGGSQVAASVASGWGARFRGPHLG